MLLALQNAGDLPVFLTVTVTRHNCSPDGAVNATGSLSSLEPTSAAVLVPQVTSVTLIATGDFSNDMSPLVSAPATVVGAPSKVITKSLSSDSLALSASFGRNCARDPDAPAPEQSQCARDSDALRGARSATGIWNTLSVLSAIGVSAWMGCWGESHGVEAG